MGHLTRGGIIAPAFGFLPEESPVNVQAEELRVVAQVGK
jgi:hypothetical protein